ncbi:copper amine oxidase N-terminal domain-containing protein [Paenibacillus jiagnxiensis]|uniref:copper amine oxidase N-terminal domain-containing protein n=1 Tax=Paenibacillus jiagnxiensis TaxID=3228926 RepID=UPI0033A96153
MKHKFFSSVCIFSLLVLLTSSVYLEKGSAAGAYLNGSILLDGKKLELSALPIIKNGTTMVPFRPIFEALGLKISWDNKSKNVTGEKENVSIKMQNGKTSAILNGKNVTISEAPFIEKNTLYVNLRFVSEATGAYVKWDSSKKEVAIQSKTDQAVSEVNTSNSNSILAKNNGVSISSAAPEQNGVFKQLTVSTSSMKKTFKWSNEANPAFYPEIHLADIDQDGKNEIVVILTSGTGTGVLIQNIHVLNGKDLSELPIENPVDAVQQNVQTSIIKEDGKVIVAATYKDQTLKKEYNEADAGVWNSKVSFSQIVRYTVKDNKINAILPGAVSPAEFAFTAVVQYGSDLKISNIQLEEGYEY